MVEKINNAGIGIVESDPTRMRVLSRAIIDGGYRVVSLEDETDFPDLMATANPDCLVLSNSSGRAETLLNRIRKSSRVPIIFVDQEDRQDDGSYVAQIFNRGADDYLVNGYFSGKQLTARIGAILRRVRLTSEDEPPVSIFNNGDLTIDYSRHLVTVQGNKVPLTPTQYKLLVFHAQNAGRPVTVTDTLSRVWGPGYEDDSLLRVNISRLRDKLGEDRENPRYLITKYGVGYMMPRINNPFR